MGRLRSPPVKRNEKDSATLRHPPSQRVRQAHPISDTSPDRLIPESPVHIIILEKLPEVELGRLQCVLCVLNLGWRTVPTSDLVPLIQSSLRQNIWIALCPSRDVSLQAVFGYMLLPTDLLDSVSQVFLG